MDKQIPTPVLYIIGFILLCLVVLGAIRAMAPRERITNDPNEAQEFKAAQQRAMQQGQQTHTWTNSQSSPPSGSR